ncbi:glutathione S-transferase family protein [Cutibacterium acnes]
MNRGDELEEAKKEVIENLKLLEDELGDKKYFGGEDFGLVDIAFVPFTSWFYSFQEFAELNVAKEFPRIAAWGELCLQRDSVAKFLPNPNKLHEFFISRRQLLGVA